MDCHFLLQGIFLTRGWDPGLPHCRQMLYCLCHQGSLWEGMQKESLVSIRVRSAALHNSAYSIISLCTTWVYKLLLKIKLWVWHQCLAPPCSSFLPFQAEFPSGAQRLSVSTYLPWLLRPMQEGAQGGARSAIQAGASGLRRWCKLFVLELY